MNKTMLPDRERKRHQSSSSSTLTSLVLFWVASASLSVATSGAEATTADHGTILDPADANPYIRGCLHTKLPSEYRKFRVCNSQDPAELRNIVCREPDFDYLEIRVASGNWASGAALSFLTQIVLSELLGVPSASEASKAGETRNFYDHLGRLDLSKTARSSHIAAASNASLLHPKFGGDCYHVTNTDDEDQYVPCAHFIPEFWGAGGQDTSLLVQAQLLEPPSGLGVLGQESWFVTKFTADEDASVVSYYGLRGDENREKLARLFKRPTTWKEYCEEVSTSNCSVPDDTAQRYPSTSQEEAKMFANGLYAGYFRYTDANNCTKWPTNCTGHVANYPCGWTSGMESNIFHFKMALDPNNGPDGSPSGYTSTQLTEMWHAANATKSNLIMMWWTPEPLYQSYLGTDTEMQHVLMNPYTLECAKAKEQYLEESCDQPLEKRVGPPEASCANPSESLSKLTTGSLYDFLHPEGIPEAAISPAYDVLRRFQISEVQLGQMFDLWESEPTPRDAVCQWAVENLEYLLSMVPSTYPRILQEEPHSTFGYAMIGLGAAASCVTLGTAILVYAFRKKPAIQYAQLDFLYILLSGSFLACIGAILSSVPASDGTCISIIWFVNIGYTLELLPLVVKVAAINRMMEAARHMRRVTLKRETLHTAVAAIAVLMAIYLAVWTRVDPPDVAAEFQMTDSKSEYGEQIVGVSYFCSRGDSNAWSSVAVGWNVLLLITASVLAFQTRNVVSTFNESQTLAFLIYSHMLFVLLRASLLVFQDNFTGTMVDNLRALLISIDQIAACVIYFLPKFIAKDEHEPSRTSFEAPSPPVGFFPKQNTAHRHPGRISGIGNEPHSDSSAMQHGSSSIHYQGGGHTEGPGHSLELNKESPLGTSEEANTAGEQQSNTNSNTTSRSGVLNLCSELTVEA